MTPHVLGAMLNRATHKVSLMGTDGVLSFLIGPLGAGEVQFGESAELVALAVNSNDPTLNIESLCAIPKTADGQELMLEVLRQALPHLKVTRENASPIRILNPDVRTVSEWAIDYAPSPDDANGLVVAAKIASDPPTSDDSAS